MKRVVVLGRGGAGKTTAAVRLARLTGLLVVELDKYFWSPDLTPTPPNTWAERQRDLAASACWIMDGDLGPYDVLEPRLARADTVLVLDYGLTRCAWRAARRTRERADFWWRLLTWRYRGRPAVLRAIATHAPRAETHILRSPRELRRFFTTRTPPPGLDEPQRSPN